MMLVFAWSSLAFGGEIHVAVKSGDLEKVKALLKDNPSLVNDKLNALYGWTPLFLATNKDMVELLIENKADIEAVDSNGYTPLRWAVIKDNKEVAETLLA